MMDSSLNDRIQALNLNAEQQAAMRQSLLLDLAGNWERVGQVLALTNLDTPLHTLGLRYTVCPALWQAWTDLQRYWQAIGGTDTAPLQQALGYGYGIPAALREVHDPHTADWQQWHRDLFSLPTLDTADTIEYEALLLNRAVLGHLVQAFEQQIPADTLRPLWDAIGLYSPTPSPETPTMPATNTPPPTDDENRDTPKAPPQETPLSDTPPVSNPTPRPVMEPHRDYTTDNPTNGGHSIPELAKEANDFSNPEALLTGVAPTEHEVATQGEEEEPDEEPEDLTPQLIGAAMLAAYRLNYKSIAQKLRYGFLTDDLAVKVGCYLPRIVQMEYLIDLILQGLAPSGIDFDELRIAIHSGLGNVKGKITYRDIPESDYLTADSVGLENTVEEVLGDTLSDAIDLHPTVGAMKAQDAIDFIEDGLSLQIRALNTIGKLGNTEQPVPDIMRLVAQWEQERQQAAQTAIATPPQAEPVAPKQVA